MSERQTSVQAEKKDAKRCSLCGARLWLKDYASNSWSGPWHFADCPEVPGGEDLSAANIEARMRRELEKPVPKEQGRRILKAIYTMLDSPNHEVMLQLKAAILEEIGKLLVKESQGNWEENHEMGALDYYSRPGGAGGDRRDGRTEHDHRRAAGPDR